MKKETQRTPLIQRNGTYKRPTSQNRPEEKQYLDKASFYNKLSHSLKSSSQFLTKIWVSAKPHEG